MASIFRIVQQKLKWIFRGLIDHSREPLRFKPMSSYWIAESQFSLYWGRRAQKCRRGHAEPATGHNPKRIRCKSPGRRDQPRQVLDRATCTQTFYMMTSSPGKAARPRFVLDASLTY